MNFDVNLDKLILYEVEKTFVLVEKEFGKTDLNFLLITYTDFVFAMIGTFGMAILHLPVTGGHDGGNFHVHVMCCHPRSVF